MKVIFFKYLFVSSLAKIFTLCKIVRFDGLFFCLYYCHPVSWLAMYRLRRFTDHHQTLPNHEKWLREDIECFCRSNVKWIDHGRVVRKKVKFWNCHNVIIFFIVQRENNYWYKLCCAWGPPDTLKSQCWFRFERSSGVQNFEVFNTGSIWHQIWKGHWKSSQKKYFHVDDVCDDVTHSVTAESTFYIPLSIKLAFFTIIKKRIDVSSSNFMHAYDVYVTRLVNNNVDDVISDNIVFKDKQHFEPCWLLYTWAIACIKNYKCRDFHWLSG